MGNKKSFSGAYEVLNGALPPQGMVTRSLVSPPASMASS